MIHIQCDLGHSGRSEGAEVDVPENQIGRS